MMKKAIIFFVLPLMISLHGFSQGLSVKGIVYHAENHSPLSGVSIVLKDTQTGVLSDKNGKYLITMPESDGILVFSMPGMQPRVVPVNKRLTIDIGMEPEYPGNKDTLPVALGIRRSRESLTYGYQGLFGENISIVHGNNVIRSLSGKLTGIDVKTNNNLGGSTNMLIRGFSSFYGNNQPLLVLDGVPFDNTISNTLSQMSCFSGYDYGIPASDLNPDNIASVNLLKGPGATALYGSRGGNGVVILTSRNMSEGNDDMRLTLNLGGSYGTYDPTTFPEYQQGYGQGFGPFYDDPSGYFLYQDINGDGDPELVAPLMDDGSYGAVFDPGMMVYQWEAFDTGSPEYGKPTPWIAADHGPSYILEHPKSYHTGIQFTAGSENGIFRFGYNRTDESGVMPNNRLTRNYLNIGSVLDLFKNMTLTANVNFSTMTSRGRYATGRCTNENQMVCFREWFPANIDIKDQKEAYFRNHENISWHMQDPSNPAPLYWDNPYFALYENYETDERNRITGFIDFGYTISDWLNISGTASLDGYNENQEERTAIGSVRESSYSRFDRYLRENNYALTLNFDKDFKGISVSGLLGGNIRHSSEVWIRAATSGGLLVPGVYALYNSVDPVKPPEESEIKKQVNSVFANVLAAWKNIIYVEGSFRRDHFSGIAHFNPTENYMSAGAGYLFSGLMGNPGWLEFGKIRINYGEAGNEFPSGFLPASYGLLGSFGGNQLISSNVAGYLYRLSFERTRGIEAGIDVSLFKDRIGFNLTRYHQNSVDQIISIPVSAATGYDRVYLNSGEMENKGWEIYMYGTILKKSNFSWSAGLNWTRNRNRVIHLHSRFPEKIIRAFPGGITTSIVEGEPYGVIQGSDFEYDNNGRKIVGTNGLYQFDRIIPGNIGFISPDWLAGISNTFRYGNFSLNILFDIRHGGDLFNVDMYYGMSTGLYPGTAGNNDLGNPMRNLIEEGGGIIFEGVKEDGSINDTRVGSYLNNLGLRGVPNAGFIYDAGYVKLREMILTWSVPEKLVRKSGAIKHMAISLTGYNLWILRKDVPYADPEDFTSAGNYAFGVQVGTYPAVRHYGFNLRVDF